MGVYFHFLQLLTKFRTSVTSLRISVEFVDNPEHKINIWRSKAVGEPPLMLSLSVWLAVKHALSCLKEKQIPKLNIPATGEEILRRMDEIHDLEGFSTKEVEIPVISAF